MIQNPCGEITHLYHTVCLLPAPLSNAELWVQFNTIDGISIVSKEEFCEIMQAKRIDLALFGYVDFDKQVLKLWLGDFRSIEISLSRFPVSGDGTVPDFSKLAIIDYGQAIQFGEYEASIDYVHWQLGFKYAAFSAYEPKAPLPRKPPKSLRQKGSSSYDASGRRSVD